MPRKKQHFKLKPDWMFSQPIDFEFNKYTLLDYIQKCEKSFDDFNEFSKTKMKAKTKKRYYYTTYGYENVIEHVMSNGEISLVKKENYDRYSLESVIEWWKVKSQKRYETLVSEGKFRTEMEIYTTESLNSGIRVDMVR